MSNVFNYKRKLVSCYPGNMKVGWKISSILKNVKDLFSLSFSAVPVIPILVWKNKDQNPTLEEIMWSCSKILRLPFVTAFPV